MISASRGEALPAAMHSRRQGRPHLCSFDYFGRVKVLDRLKFAEEPCVLLLQGQVRCWGWVNDFPSRALTASIANRFSASISSLFASFCCSRSTKGGAEQSTIAFVVARFSLCLSRAAVSCLC